MMRFNWLFGFFAALKFINSEQLLVALKSSVSLEAFLESEDRFSKDEVKSFISNSFKIGDFAGFFGDFSDRAIEKFNSCPLVAEVTPDIPINAFDVVAQTDAPRHLARLGQQEILGEPPYTYYYNDTSNIRGNEVNAYVIDSGIFVGHKEFGGRAKRGIDFTGEGTGDLNGHGTHVAGIIGSRSYGVSKKVNMIEVKALDKKGYGALSSIISAIEFAVNDRKQKGIPGVANLSLGSVKNSVLNRAVNAAVNTGLVIVVAAGNSNLNACYTSPASAKQAITVGAIDDRTDSIAPFSNWGKCVDIFASGTHIASVSSLHEDRAQILSGTSMSSPVITGIVALLLSKGVSPFEVKDYLISLSAKDQIPRSSLLLRRKSPNRIAQYHPETEIWLPSEDSDSDE